MSQYHFDEWPEHLPELGQSIAAHSAEIMRDWESLIEQRMPSSERTAHRVALRDHLPQFLQSLARDLSAGRDGKETESRPAAREHGLQRWRQGYELELVVRDYQLLFHAIVGVVQPCLERELTVAEVQNLSSLLNEASLIAINTFNSFQTETNRPTSPDEHADSVFESCTDAVIVVSIDGIIRKWNPGAEALYGYQAQEIVGSPLSVLIGPERKRELERYMKMLRSGKVVEPIDTVRQRVDGSEVSVSFAATPLFFEDEQNRFVIIERDISHRVRAAEALREALEEAERANRAKSEFLANVSHELRTPMNAILGMTELALAEEVTPELRDYLQTSHESAQMLLALVNDVLDLSKLEAGKIELETVPFSLREMLDDTIRSLSSRAYRKGLEIACVVSNKIPDTLVGDPLRLRQIITNLVGNAIKFTDAGEIVVEVNLDVKSGKSCVLRFSVSDTGIGISETDQQRIFAPFTQADASSTRQFAGTGLGLAISAHLVNCLRGQFWVQSEVGVGSIFYFTARFAMPDDQRSTKDLQQTDILSLRNMQVLVADDNDTNRTIIGSLLSDWQMRPVLACDAPSAIDTLAAAREEGESIPLVVIDALMPHQDGFDLAAEIKAAEEPQPKTILMLSAADRIAFKERVEELEIDGIIEKPISQSNLFDAIASTMGVATVDQQDADPKLEKLSAELSLEVLLVEDTPANRKVVERILSKRGHRVTSASNGREALDLVRERDFSLVLMDVQMPSMDGIQATEAIRSHEAETGVQQHIPIIAMTAHAMAGDRQRCLAAGMDDYISKPISIRNVINIVEKYGMQKPSNLQTKQGPPVEKNACSSKEDSESNGDLKTEIDLEKAKERLAGDEELLDDLIGFYLEDYPPLVEQIERAVTDNNSEALQRAAHSLKGLISNFEAENCRELAERVEHDAKHNDVKTAASNFGALKEMCRILAQELIHHRESRTHD